MSRGLFARVGVAAPWAAFLLGALLWVPVGGVLATLGQPSHGVLASNGVPALPPDMVDELAEQEGYTFLTFRRNLWLIRHTEGTVQYFIFPESEEQPLFRSQLLEIDRESFPVDQVRYQLSERNLASYLWILNPVTGKALYLRARRDGSFEASSLFDATKRS
ncbi:MAG: hypothetical protein ACE5GW_01555 [Planctomycetota bacterium]